QYGEELRSRFSSTITTIVKSPLHHTAQRKIHRLGTLCGHWLNSEANRLETFKNWKYPIEPALFAAAGFYKYEDDSEDEYLLIICYFCKLELPLWDLRKLNPLDIHIKNLPIAIFSVDFVIRKTLR